MNNNEIKILLADDEPDILEILHFNLSKENYQVYTANDGNACWYKALELNPDLIVLDIMMPKKSGVEVLQMLRSHNQFEKTIIVMLTALSDDTTHIAGLEKGADDYITKPISPRVFVSKIKSLLRRKQNDEVELSKENDKIIFDNFIIDPSKFAVIINGKEIELAKKEFYLLHLLAANKEKIFERNEILQRVWGNDVIVGDRTIDVHIRKIRRKLTVDCIKTIKGVGYKFVY